MTVHRLTGIRTGPLASYLAGLGLARLVGQQADPAAVAWWEGDVLCLDTAVEDVPAWLVDEYVPTPVLSPWNGGSGFGAKDRNQRSLLDRLLTLDNPRLDPYREAFAVVARLMSELPAGADKVSLLRSLRNRAPDAMLEWLDAAVVILDGDLAFPPLLGTGGNDGRLDFSINFVQRLLDVFDPSPSGRPRSVAWLDDLLTGSSARALVSAATGQFDPWAAGGKNSSSYGAADSLVNPWQFVLMVEGSMLFGSATARRLSGERGRAAMPFTVAATDAAARSGSAVESSRGEVWMPVWQNPMTLTEMRQIFREARASWRGRTATRAAQMYEATQTLGVSRGVDRFIRYGFHQRNGLAFVASPLDDVQVHDRSEVRLLRPIESWMERVSPSGPAQTLHLRTAQRHQVEFARNGRGEDLVQLLASLARLHQVLALRPTDELRFSPLRLAASPLFAFLAARDQSPELRIAVGLASRTFPVAQERARGRFCDVVLPVRTTSGRLAWGSTRVTGLGTRPVVNVVADVLVWRAMGESGSGPFSGAGQQAPVMRGHLPFDVGNVRPQPGDAQAWARNQLDDHRVGELLLAMCLVDWRAPGELRWQGAVPTAVPQPALAQLGALAAGLAPRSAAAASSAAELFGWRPDWALRLRAGRSPEVLTDVRRVCRQAGWDVVQADDLTPGRRLLAAASVGIPHPMAALRLTLADIDSDGASSQERRQSVATTHHA